MAGHIDKQIRAAAVTALTGLATTGARVFASREYPLQDAELPALRLFVGDSDIQAVTFGARAQVTRQERAIELRVEFCGKATANYDDQADAAKLEVEKAIAADITLGGIVKSADLRRIETERDDSGEKILIVTRMIFLCTAYTARNAPDVPA